VESGRRFQGQLFRKYLAVLLTLVTGTLLVSGIIEAYFSYREQEASLGHLHRARVTAAAVTISQFMQNLYVQVAAVVPPPWDVGAISLDERESDFRRVLRNVPSVTEVRYVDSSGREQLHVSRIGPTVLGSGIDYSAAPEFLAPRSGASYFSPVYFRGDSEPYLAVAVADPGRNPGVTVAHVSLKFLQEVVLQADYEHAGVAYVVDPGGQLIAHPDISFVLQKLDLSYLPQVRAALASGVPPEAGSDVGRDPRGEQVFSAYRRVDPPGWVVFVEQPLAQAFAPVRESVLRTIALLLAGLMVSIVASFVLARRMVAPIQALQAAAARVGAGALDQRIEVRSRDELQALAEEFNQMSSRLRDSYTNLERKVEERTRDLAETMAQLEVANQHKSQLLSTVSHELRTPLAAIKGYSTALLRFGPRIRGAERREFLESIDRSTDRLSALIEDLLTAQRLEAGALPIQAEQLDVAALAREATSEIAARTTFHHFLCELPDGLPSVRGDGRRVRQVLLNLLDNAVKYSPEGGDIAVRAEAVDGEVLVSVRDQGLGISPDELARVFERFHRVESGQHQTARGTGLGLAICEGLVEAQGGRIWAESAGLGQGSVFHFTLPRWPAS
jgi:signal transduction histidine kinase